MMHFLSGQSRISVFLPVWICLLIFFSANSRGDTDTKRILYLTSYSTAYEWTRENANGFRDYFSSKTPHTCIDVVELGILRNVGQNMPTPDYSWVFKKFQSCKYKILVAADLPALEVIERNLSQLPPDISLVFCGGIPPDRIRKIAYPNKTGLLRSLNTMENIELGLKQFPDTKEIAVITVAGSEGKYIQDQVAQNPLLKQMRLHLISGSNTSTKSMLRQIGKLTKNSLVVFTNWRSVVQEDFETFPNIVKSLVACSPGPIYTTVDSYLNLGLFGGFMTEAFTHGRETAKVCEQILSGTPASDIPVKTGCSVLKFNWTQFKKCGFSPAMTEKTDFVDRPLIWWSANRDWIPFTTTILALLLSSLFFLYRDHRKARRTQAIYDAMPLRIVITDSKGKIYFHQAENDIDPVTLENLPQQMGIRFQDTISKVMATGENQWKEYDYLDMRRKAIFTRLPKQIFGTETVMWISMDITELSESRDQLRMSHELLNNTTKLANIEYFHFDQKNQKHMFNCDRYWPKKDGLPVPVDQWIAAEDREAFRTVWRQMLDGEKQSIQISYRAGQNDQIRDYVMYAQHDIPCGKEKNDGAMWFVGMIQDISELKSSIRNYQDTANLLDMILSNFPNLVTIKNISDDFRYVMVNRNLLKQFDLKHTDIIGKTDFDIFPNPEDAERVQRYDLCAVEDGDLIQREEHFHDLQGVRHDVITTRSVVSKSNGTQLLVTVITDISELKRTQQAAEESNQILRAILDHVHAGITVKDPDHDFRYIIWNQWLKEKTGMESEQVLGKTNFELPILSDVQQHFHKNDLRACETGFLREVMEKTEKDGHFTVSDITRKLLTFPSGKRLLITSVSDLTKERMAALEREKMIAQQNSYIEYERIINRCLQAITLQTDMKESIEFLLREIGETVHADSCHIFQFSEDNSLLNNVYEWVASDIAPMHEMLQNIDSRKLSGFHKRLLKKEDIVIGTLSQTQPDDLQEAMKLMSIHKVQTVLICGIWENERLWGFVEINFIKQVRTIASSDIHIVRNAANLFLLVRERDIRINELADNMSLQTQIFDNISVPILLLDAENNVIKTNSAMEKRSRMPHAPACGDKCYHHFCEGKTRPPEDCPARQVMKTGKPCTINRHIGNIYMQIYAQPIYDRSGKLIYILESGYDVSVLRRQQEQLAVYLNQERVINECLKNLVLNQDFDTVLKDIIQMLSQQMQAEVCSVFRYNAAIDALVKVQMLEMQNADGDRVQDIIYQKDFPACFQALRNGGFSADLRDRQTKPEHLELYPYLEARKMLAIACVPIYFHHEYWGYIAMEFNDSNKIFGEVEIRLLAAAARILEVLLERETLYAKLLNSENEKNMIWELMTVPMVLFDANRNILRVNPAMERLCNMTSAEIMSQPCFLPFCKNSVDHHDCPISLMLQNPKPQHKEVSILGREFDIFTLPVLENGTLTRILQIFIDITENNANKRKLLSAIDAAEAAGRAKSTFLATMSHEIRTPLNAVIGFSELLQRGEVAPKEQLEYLRSINFAGNALLQLINDILDLSKLDSGQMDIVCEKADLFQLCEEMMAIFSLKGKEKQLDLRLNYPENMPNLFFSVSRLRQVLLNLIGNAVKFTFEGEIVLSITFLKQDEKTGTLKIEIRDTGLGIADEYKETIFQPFVQQRNARFFQEGTGLGLTISKRLVEYMGGKLSFESTLGKGSCFSIVLPEIRYDTVIQNTPKISNPNVSVQKHKMLLVDDVPLNLKVLQAMLKQFNVEVITAASGKEALEKLQTFTPDLVLTDMWMPEMDGLGLAQQIRRIPEFSNIIILAVTADSEASSTFSMDYFNGILLKPVSIDKLQKMFQLIENNELQQGILTLL